MRWSALQGPAEFILGGLKHHLTFWTGNFKVSFLLAGRCPQLGIAQGPGARLDGGGDGYCTLWVCSCVRFRGPNK